MAAVRSMSVGILSPSSVASCSNRCSSSSGSNNSCVPGDGQCHGSRWQISSRKFLGGNPLRAAGSTALRNHGTGRSAGQARAEKWAEKKAERMAKGPLLDPFDWGEDPELEYGDLFTEGKQSAELPKPPMSEDGSGYLDFPKFHNLELSTLGTYIRNDVRRCLCWVHGGVYENLLFFPGIELLRNRYPGVRIDVLAGPRGKQTYEMNKYINKTFVFDSSAEWTAPDDLAELIGDLRNEYYDLILSTKYAGFKHTSMLFMIGGRSRRISYVPKYHSEFITNRMLTEGIEAQYENLAEGGYNMYADIFDYVAQPAKGVPQEPIPTLQVGVSRRVKKLVHEKEEEAGVLEGKFVVFHGIESTSAASMTSPADTDCLLPNRFWAQLKSKMKEFTTGKVVIVIPHKREEDKVLEECGDDVSVVFITTPGQLASLIRDSIGVVSTNTAAMLMAIALNKPSVALFGSSEKAALFVPEYAEKVKAVASKTGKLADVDVDEACTAWRYVMGGQLVLAS